jgi:hypothetical protein
MNPNTATIVYSYFFVGVAILAGVGGAGGAGSANPITGSSVTYAGGGGGTWIQTSYNAKFRGKYAGIGDKYDSVKDEFVSPEITA